MLEDYEILTICFLLITGPSGILINLYFIIITLTKKKLHKNYSWFLCGMSAANLLYCANSSINQVIALWQDLDIKNGYCQIIGVVLVSTALSSMCMQPLIGLNRYVGLYYSNWQPKIFCPRNNATMIFSVYLVCFIVAVVLYIFNDMGRMGNTVCGPQIENMEISHVCFFAVPIVTSYCICIFCAYKILRLIRNHQSSAQEVGSKLQDMKEMFRLLIIELFLPITLETPILLFSLLSSHVYIPRLVIAISVCLFIIHPVCDPIVVFFVIKPYRIYIQQIWNKCCKSNVVDITSTDFEVTRERN